MNLLVIFVTSDMMISKCWPVWICRYLHLSWGKSSSIDFCNELSPATWFSAHHSHFAFPGSGCQLPSNKRRRCRRRASAGRGRRDGRCLCVMCNPGNRRYSRLYRSIQVEPPSWPACSPEIRGHTHLSLPAVDDPCHGRLWPANAQPIVHSSRPDKWTSVALRCYVDDVVDKEPRDRGKVDESKRMSDALARESIAGR